jgi:hypothetical protein
MGAAAIIGLGSKHLVGFGVLWVWGLVSTQEGGGKKNIPRRAKPPGTGPRRHHNKRVFKKKNGSEIAGIQLIFSSHV